MGDVDDNTNIKNNNSNCWGTISVGPLLRNKLIQNGLKAPTKIQEVAFPIISKGNNAVIASPTGTGKSLAFLIPIICRFGYKIPYFAIIVTPSIELTKQIQNTIEEYLNYQTLNNKKGITTNPMHVLKST